MVSLFVRRHYHQMNGELALRLIRAIRTGTESPSVDSLLVSSNATTQPSTSTTTSDTSSTPNSSIVADDIDIVPYKCSCPYSSSSSNDNASMLKVQLKKFTKFVKNIPCDRPCPVNLYRHLRNYHKVDLQHAKDITRTIMSAKAIKTEEFEMVQPTIEHGRNKRMKLPVRDPVSRRCPTLFSSLVLETNQSFRHWPHFR